MDQVTHLRQATPRTRSFAPSSNWTKSFSDEASSAWGPIVTVLAFICCTCEARAPNVSGKLLDLTPSLESAVYLRAKVELHNPETRPVKVTQYVVRWKDGRKEVVPDHPTLDPGQTIVTHTKVFFDSGDLKTLSVASAGVDVMAEWTR